MESAAKSAYIQEEKKLQCLADWAEVPGSGFDRHNFEREVLHDRNDIYLTYRFDPSALVADPTLGVPDHSKQLRIETDPENAAVDAPGCPAGST